MSSVEGGHDAAVGHAQTIDALDPELGVDDSLGVVCLAHGTGAGWVVAYCESKGLTSLCLSLSLVPERTTQLTGCRILLDKRNPVLSGRVPVMDQLPGPRPLDDVPGPLAVDDDLVGEPARLGHDLDVERISQVVGIDERDVAGVRAAQRHGAARPGRKQLGHEAKGVAAADGKVGEALGPAVALDGHELDVGLARRQAHGVAAGLARRGVPYRRVGEARVEARKGHAAKGEAREHAGLVVLPQRVGPGEAVVVEEVLVDGQALVLGFVDDESDLGWLSVGICQWEFASGIIVSG